MLPSDKQILNRNLKQLYKAIDNQMLHFATMAEEKGVGPQELQDVNGIFLLPPLLLAQSNVLSAMVTLNKE